MEKFIFSLNCYLSENAPDETDLWLAHFFDKGEDAVVGGVPVGVLEVLSVHFPRRHHMGSPGKLDNRSHLVPDFNFWFWRCV